MLIERGGDIEDVEHGSKGDEHGLFSEVSSWTDPAPILSHNRGDKKRRELSPSSKPEYIVDRVSYIWVEPTVFDEAFRIELFRILVNLWVVHASPEMRRLRVSLEVTLANELTRHWEAGEFPQG